MRDGKKEVKTWQEETLLFSVDSSKKATKNALHGKSKGWQVGRTKWKEEGNYLEYDGQNECLKFSLSCSTEICRIWWILNKKGRLIAATNGCSSVELRSSVRCQIFFIGHWQKINMEILKCCFECPFQKTRIFQLTKFSVRKISFYIGICVMSTIISYFH